MPEYLLIETRDAFASNDVQRTYELATSLAKTAKVTLYLIENGVLAARESAQSAKLSQLSRSGVRVLADGFSLHERGIDVRRLPPGLETAPVDVIVEHLAAGHSVLWN